MKDYTDLDLDVYNLIKPLEEDESNAVLFIRFGPDENNKTTGTLQRIGEFEYLQEGISYLMDENENMNALIMNIAFTRLMNNKKERKTFVKLLKELTKNK